MKTYLEYLFWDSRWIELRHDRGSQLRNRWQTGWFDNPDDLRKAATSRLATGNLYTSLHRPLPRDVSNEMTGDATRNSDIERYTRLFFDFDPVREKDTAATDCQVTEARQRALEVKYCLRLLGWPDPLVAESGNGVHLQYRIALPNTPEWQEALRVLYGGMAEEFSDDRVEFDPVVRNPGRICTLYGSVKRKGTDTQLHRRSTVWVPDPWPQVTRRQVEDVANYYAKQCEVTAVTHPTRPFVAGNGDYRTLDVAAWFQFHNHYRRYCEDHKHYVQCPWSDEHTEVNPAGTDTLIYEADGESWPGFYCHHKHCEGRRIRDVMALWGDADSFCTRQFGGAL